LHDRVQDGCKVIVLASHAPSAFATVY